MDPLDFMVDSILETTKAKLSDSDRQKYKDVMLKIVKQGMKPKEALGFSSEMLEHIYAYGYRLYNMGSYRKANQIFTALTTLEPADLRFQMALASSFHRLKNYPQAIQYYFNCGIKQKSNPMPFFYMYDCFIQQNMREDALFCLEEVVRRCGEDKKRGALKERCKLMLTSLRQPPGQPPSKQPASETMVKKAA